MNIQITPGMTHGGTQFTTEQWGEAALDIALGRTEEGRVVRNISLAALSLFPAVRILRATKPARYALSWIRHPVANYLARYRGWTWLGTGAKYYLHANKGYRYANYVAFAYSPFATYHYLKADEYEKAMIQLFGPLGGVYVYEKYIEKPSKGSVLDQKMIGVGLGRPDRSLTQESLKKTSSKMPQAQRMRLWRMGLRWCKKHNRYDRCSLRARK
tara:strand:- start:473 stop:1114 length:642 start_codon:yes stop_codon:yes gene_type:complete